jgi:hypothetical protein
MVSGMKYKLKWRAGGAEPLQPEMFESARQQRKGHANCCPNMAIESRLMFGMKTKLGK